MKSLSVFLVILFCALFACTAKKDLTALPDAGKVVSDTVRIANDALEYEIVIIDPGFNGWFAANAKPRGYYSQNYLEGRNREWVQEWNIRASNPAVYGTNFLVPIDYQNTIDYGYEVNYMLYYYLTYYQIVNNIRLGSFTPRL